MNRWLILFLSFAINSAVAFSQTQLARTVVASGGTLALPSADGVMFMSSTIGQTLILAQAKPDSSSVFQGFWVPVAYGLVGVDDGSDKEMTGEISNYPNPVVTSTTIRFSVPMDGRVNLRVFGLVGDLVRTVVVDLSAAGSQEILLMAVDELGAPLASGTYLYEVEGTTASGSPFRRTQRLNILR